jgi:tetratricopeptide (TPR) repeat protein
MNDQAKIDELQVRLARMRGFLAQDPNNLKLRYEVIDLLTHLGEFEAARAEIAAALDRAANDAGLRFRLATLDLASGQSPRAVETLRAMQAEGIDNAVIRYNLGYALMMSGDYESARQVLETIPLDDAQAPRTRVLLGRCLHHLDEIEKGVALVRDYVAQHAQDADALGVLSLMEWDEGHNQDALATAKRALEVDPDNIEAGIVMGSYALDEQNVDEAKADFNRVITRHPSNGRAWSGLGLAHMAEIDLAGAMPALKNATQFMPDHIGTWHALAWCQIVQGDLAGARQNLEAALALNRNFSESHGGLAVIAAMEKRYEDAEKLIRRALRLDPNSFSGRFAQSLVTNRTNPEAATQMIRDILNSKTSETSSETLTQALQRTAARRKKR